MKLFWLLAVPLGLAFSVSAQAKGIRTLLVTDTFCYRCEPADIDDKPVMLILESRKAKWVLQTYYPEYHNSSFSSLKAPLYAQKTVTELKATYDECEIKRKADFADKQKQSTYAVH